VHPGAAPAQKAPERAGKVLIVDASSLYRKGRAQNFLDPEHGATILGWVRAFADAPDRARVVTQVEIAAEDWTLNISRYVLPPIGADIPPLPEAVSQFKAALERVREAEDDLRRVMTKGAGWHERPLPVQELESYLWGAAVILRGLVDAGDYKQFVFPLLFFKRCRMCGTRTTP
jgi:type I restriction-modification system DNA methylase subunit